MKIFNGAKLVYDLPSKPKNFDGWVHGNKFGIEVGNERITFGKCDCADRARYQLKQVLRAYLDDAETFNITEATT